MLFYIVNLSFFWYYNYGDIFISYFKKWNEGNQMKNTNQTTATQNHLANLMQERNRLIEWHNRNAVILANCNEFESVNAEIMQTISEIATYKTLKFLMSNNATNNTATENTDNGTQNTYGYNMALRLFNSAYNDIKIMHNAEITTDILSDTADLIQESTATLTPYFTAPVVFSLDDIIYTKQLKNGNLKEYTAFQLACKTIRAYITAQDKKQYKKLAYVIGITDNGNQVTTTKRPKNDISDTTTEQQTAFIKRYRLTDAEQTAILNHINGKSTTETAEQMGVSKRTIERLLKSAREKIAKADNRIKL